MFNLPREGSKAATHMTPHVHACLAEWRKLPTRAEAAAYARNYFATSRSGATGLFNMVLQADDSVALVFLGIRGGFRVVHNFGKAA